MRQAHLIRLCLLGLTLFSALTSPEVLAKKKPDPALTPVSVQLRWYHQFQFAGYYVARDLGYYAEAGLDVTLREGHVGIDPVEQVVSGDADFGIDNSGLLKARAEGQPVRALAAIFQRSAMRFITMPDSGIEQASDLAGKRVMLSPDYGSLALIATLNTLAMLDKVERIDSSHDIMDLVEGRTDAFNGYISNEPYVLESMGIEANVIDPADSGIEFYSDVLFSSDALTNAKPRLVQAFTRATLQGWEYAFHHPEATIDIVQRYAPSKTAGQLRYEANSLLELAMPDLIEIGHMNTARWREIQRQLLAMGLIEPGSSIDIDAFIFDVEHIDNGWRKYRTYITAAMVLICVLAILVIYSQWHSWRLEKEIERSRQSEATAFRMATHDPLTGLANRLLLIDRLSIMLVEAARHNWRPMIVFLDLDNFKLVNDTHGHQKGDELLKAVAMGMLSSSRSSETVARLSGDEFILIAANANKRAAEAVGQRLVDTVREICRGVVPDIEVGASVGIVLVENAVGMTAEDVIQLADDAMYGVKNASKNAFDVRVIGAQSA